MTKITAKLILLIGGLGAVIYGFPGYLNNEAALQLGQARTGHYDDVVPPLMARYWHLTDQLYHGQLPLLILQIALVLWGAYGLIATRFTERASAIAAVLLLWFPPVLAPMSIVCKEAQMAGWLLAGTMLMLRPSARARVGGLVMLVVACAVCHAAVWAVIPLVVMIVRSAAVRGFARTMLVSLVLIVAITMIARAVDAFYTDRETHTWERIVVSHDIAGTLCYSPHHTDDETAKLLAGLDLQKDIAIQGRFCNGWSPRHPLTSNPEISVFDLSPRASDFAARTAVLHRLVRTYPASYATQRWKVIQELVGLGRTPPDDTVIQTYWGNEEQGHHLFVDAKPSQLQHWLGGWIAAWGTTALFRPWAYFLIAFAMLLFAAWKRDGMVAAFAASGLIGELTVAMTSVEAQFRFSHWLIASTCLAVIFVLGRSRWRG
ncbi:MAG: hypothetical protein QM831_15910 [Kofleriaceae bacterium]